MTTKVNVFNLSCVFDKVYVEIPFTFITVGFLQSYIV